MLHLIDLVASALWTIYKYLGLFRTLRKECLSHSISRAHKLKVDFDKCVFDCLRIQPIMSNG